MWIRIGHNEVNCTLMKSGVRKEIVKLTVTLDIWMTSNRTVQ